MVMYMIEPKKIVLLMSVTLCYAISIGASALGISSLERHITIDRAMYGSDQSASLEPSGLRLLVGSVRKVEGAIGNGEKIVSDKELVVAKKLREHLSWQAK